MPESKTRRENTVLAFVVVWVALAAGTLVTTAMGQQLPDAPSTNQGVSQPQVEARFLPPQPAPRNWVLGVRADVSETGYLVRFVQPNSAAKRAGLEPGDRIVAIDGQLIGRVGHKLFRLSDTLEQAAGHDGRVRLLIQNWRNKRLVSLRVTLMSPAQHLGS